MQTCQDNYSTVFSSFGEMQTYHQRLSKESQWRRCCVRDLTIEPLDSKSPLAEDLLAFAPGTSQEAVRDTVRGLGLAMRVEGNLYPCLLYTSSRLQSSSREIVWCLSGSGSFK